jgi:tetratricopeptide (TPR) repeat protein
VLEGSVRKAGNSVRITAQLIKAGTDTHLWSQTYDRKLDDIFKIQDEIAAAVVEQLKIKLLGEAPTAKPVDGRAYALFLQGRAVERQGSAEAFAQAIALYQQAVAIDASDVAAWTGLAEVYCLQEYQYQRPAAEATRLAREALEHALASDPGYAPAHAQLGWIAIFLDRDLSAAARHLEHALTLDPGNTDVLGIAAILARRLGRFEQAVAIGRHLLAHDPVSPTGWDDLGYALLYAGHRDEAMAAFRKVLQLSPNFAGQHWNIAGLLAQEGDAATAMADAQQESDAQFRLYALTAAHFALGEKEKSDALFAEAIERYGATSSYSIGLLAALRGQTDLSFEWLDKALEHGEPDLGAIPAYPTFILLRSDPRWLPFLRKIGYAPEQLEKIEFKVTLPQAQGGAASSGANQ